LKRCGVIFPLIDLKKKAVVLFEAFPVIMYYVQSFIVIFFLSLFVRFTIDPDSLEFGSQELRFLNHDFLPGVEKSFVSISFYLIYARDVGSTFILWSFPGGLMTSCVLGVECACNFKHLNMVNG